VARSALVEAAAQFTRALDQLAKLPATPTLRREQITLQVALITPLMHIKGYGAPETKAAAERARLLIEQAEALGEPPEDPLLLFSVLYGFWVAKAVAFDGDVMRDLAAQFLALAEKQKATTPLMVGHRIVGVSLYYTGDIVNGHCIWTRRSRSTTPPSIVPWRLGSVTTSECRSCHFGPSPCGCSVIRKPPWQTWIKRPKALAK